MNKISKKSFTSNSQKSPIMDTNNINIKNNINQNNQTSIYQSFRCKLNVKLTKEENILYNKIYNMLKNNEGIIASRSAANFMKTSGLDKNILKNIWLIASQTSLTHIDKEELFVILRLIALAQNNIPFSAENIKKNEPLPPYLPQFNLNKNNNMNPNNQINFRNEKDQDNHNNNNQPKDEKIDANSIFDIPDEKKITYKNIFNNLKETNFERITAREAIIFWKSNNVEDLLIRDIARIIMPLENNGQFNLKEFQVACHLINISKNIKFPDKLPLCLIDYLGRNKISKEQNIINNKYISESEINELKKKLNEEKNKNKLLMEENCYLKGQLEILNIEIEKIDKLKIKIKSLEDTLTQKNIEIQNYISQNNSKDDKYIIKSILPGEKILAVNFVSIGNQDIGHYNLVCKNIDLFVRLEERLYEDFPKFKEYETYFEVNTKRVKRFKTLEENKIKTNDIINIFIIEN